MIDKEIIAVFHYDDKGSKCCGAEPYRYAEEIIRCKECKYYKQSEAFCENGNGLWQAGDECFCSYGEREGK